MTWTHLAERFRAWQEGIKQALNVSESDRNGTYSPEWYAGLVVSPASFSRQLGDLQASLVRANTTVMANTIRSTTPQFDSANAEQIAVRTQRGA